MPTATSDQDSTPSQGNNATAENAENRRNNNNNTTAENTSSENGGNNRRRNNNNNSRREQSTIQLTNPKNYEGSISEVGAILALKHEKLDKKVQYQVFTEKVANYIYSNVKNGGDLIPLFSSLRDPMDHFNSKRKPKKLTETQLQDTLEVDIYKESIKVYVSGRTTLTRNVEKTYGIIWGQCSSALQSKIKSVSEYTSKSMELDALWLLQELKKTTSGIDSKAEPRSTLIDSFFGIFKIQQGPTEANDAFLERYKANVGVVELAAGDYIFCCNRLMTKVNAEPTDDEISIEKDRFKAMLLLKNADNRRYGGLVSRLKEGASLGRNEYPTTVADMYELMCSHCPDLPTNNNNNNNRNNHNNNNNNRNGVNLLQHGNTSASSVHLLQLGVMLTQSNDNDIIDSNWVLLDTCSTDSVFNNNTFLSKISKCKDNDVLNIVSNGGGAVSYDTTGCFDLLSMPVYYNKNSLANVLSFKQVTALNGVRITLDTSVEKAMLVHVNGVVLKFRECKDGLYYLNMENFNIDNYKNKSTVNHYSHASNNICLVTTVENNKSFFFEKTNKNG